MSVRHDAPPFQRGEYSSEAADMQFEGKEYWFDDLDYSTSTFNVVTPARVANRVKVRVVKNVSGFALLPAKAAAPDTANGRTAKSRANGHTRTTAAPVLGIVDEHLPSTGVPDGAVFYLTVEGPTAYITPSGADATNVITLGNRLVALTASTSGAPDAGRLTPQDLTGATALLADQVQNSVGTAMSAGTTAETGVRKLVYVSML